MEKCLQGNTGLAGSRWFGPLRLAVFCLLVPLMAGCLQVETLVAVKTDGSGTVTERFLLGQEAVAMFAQMAPEGETFSLLDEAQLREDAAKYGPGVTLVSAEALETDFGQGYLAVYAFEDINTLQVEQDPGGKMPDAPGMQQEPETEPPTTITFAMASASPAELTVHWPIDQGEMDAAAEPEAPAPSPEEEAQAMEMMKGFFKDMRMAMIVEVEGEITETNATHRDGSRVTLMDFAFGEILGNPEAMKLMMSKEPESIADMKELAEAVPGLKVEFEPEVKIAFE